MRTLNRALMVVTSALVITSLAAGCGGDDDDDSSGDVSTGIAPSTLLSDVSAEDSQNACERVQAGFERALPNDVLIRAVCTLGAASATETQADCEELRDQCLEEANTAGSETMMELDGATFEFECDGGGNLSECTGGTVGDLEACLNDTLDLLDATLGQVSCAQAGMVDTESFGADVQEPASCAAVQCPEGSTFGP
jgi:hypothetical protein